MKFTVNRGKKIINIKAKSVKRFISVVMTLSFIFSSVYMVSAAAYEPQAGEARMPTQIVPPDTFRFKTPQSKVLSELPPPVSTDDQTQSSELPSPIFPDQLDDGVKEDFTRIGKLGGSYEDLRAAKAIFMKRGFRNRDDYEAHHLIARDALNQFVAYLKENNCYTKFMRFMENTEQLWAPAIIMTKEDHAQTRSYKNNRFTSMQYERLRLMGDFSGELEDELNFILEKFPGKYDLAIEQVRVYIKDLNFRVADGRVKFDSPYLENGSRFYFMYRPEMYKYYDIKEVSSDHIYFSHKSA